MGRNDPCSCGSGKKYKNGLTPLEAVKHPSGKAKVIEILKLIESLEEDKKQCGDPHFDPSWLWQRLGIER